MAVYEKSGFFYLDPFSYPIDTRDNRTAHDWWAPTSFKELSKREEQVWWMLVDIALLKSLINGFYYLELNPIISCKTQFHEFTVGF